MGRVQLDPKISVGHILQIAALIVGLTAGYYQLKADDDRLAGRIEVLEVTAGARIDANTRSIKAQDDLLAVKLTAIQRSLDRLETEIKELRAARP